MKYLLDTSTFLWLVGARERLNAAAIKVLESEESELLLSVVSVWEIVIKVRAEKLSLDCAPAQYFPRWQSVFALRTLPVLQRHALELSNLPSHHRDPFDLMLVAQAKAEDMILLTTDRLITKYPVRTLLCGR